MGITQGLLASMVADTAPADLRGTAFGLFNLLSGVVMLGASALAGWVWDRLGAPATFLAGASSVCWPWAGWPCSHWPGTHQASRNRAGGPVRNSRNLAQAPASQTLGATAGTARAMPQ